LDWDPAAVLFGVGLIAGILGPIALEWSLRRAPIARRLLLGQSRKAAARERIPLSVSASS